LKPFSSACVTFIFFYRDCKVPVTSEEWQGSCERDQQRGQDAPAHRRGNQQPATHQAPHQPGLRQKLSHEARRKFDLNLFILGLLQNKLSQLILITLERSFRMVSISFFLTRFDRREKPDQSLYAERQAWKHLVPFL